MSRGRQYDDGAILEALATCGTVTAAAASLGCSRKLIYSRMMDGTFSAQLQAFRAERLRATAQALDAASLDAVQTLQSIMLDDEASNSDKIKAAVTVLDARHAYADKLKGAEGSTAASALDYGFDDLAERRDIWGDCDI